MFQFSLAATEAVCDYVEDLLQKGTTRPNQSPYGAPLFFVKGKDKLRGFFDYRALNWIPKWNNAPLRKYDEMFDRLGRSSVFTKMNLNTEFNQIRMKPEDVEKAAFNSKHGKFE